MSPAEYIELIQNDSSISAQHFMNAVQAFFAYIVTAFFVGNKLSRIQIIVVNILYSVFLTLPVFAKLISLPAPFNNCLRAHWSFSFSYGVPMVLGPIVEMSLIDL